MAAAEKLPVAQRASRRKRGNGPVSRFWRKVRKPLAESRFVKGALASSIALGMRFVRWTNPLSEESTDTSQIMRNHPTAIFAFWHGQHILALAYKPQGYPLVAMFSKSADAELNAIVAEKFGFETVRGSGGRERQKSHEKGGARALIALKRALDQGKSICMIADIPHGEPRQAGLGIVTLARISGRPVIGIAIATSRRKVLERSWDKTTVNLPFGRSAFICSEPVFVPADADEAEMERLRGEVTAALNAATATAYSIVDAAR